MDIEKIEDQLYKYLAKHGTGYYSMNGLMKHAGIFLKPSRETVRQALINMQKKGKLTLDVSQGKKTRVIIN